MNGRVSYYIIAPPTLDNLGPIDSRPRVSIYSAFVNERQCGAFVYCVSERGEGRDKKRQNMYEYRRGERDYMDISDVKFFRRISALV